MVHLTLKNNLLDAPTHPFCYHSWLSASTTQPVCTKLGVISQSWPSLLNPLGTHIKVDRKCHTSPTNALKSQPHSLLPFRSVKDLLLVCFSLEVCHFVSFASFAFGFYHFPRSVSNFVQLWFCEGFATKFFMRLC